MKRLVRKAQLKDLTRNEPVIGIIQLVDSTSIEKSAKMWFFDWRKLSKQKGVTVFGVTKSESNDWLGLLAVSINVDGMIQMLALESAKKHIGTNKTIGGIAGSLIAFACEYAAIYGFGNYQGVLVFDAKSELINHYSDTYGAQLLFGQRMLIEQKEARVLAQKYLKDEKES